MRTPAERGSVVGLLSIREVRDGMPRLGTLNHTVRRLMYGYLRGGSATWWGGRHALIDRCANDAVADHHAEGI